jgi:hypothetical protein
MEAWKIKKVTKMANKGNLEWDGLCQPCKKIGVCATGSEYCENCRHIFCFNCSKFHKAHDVGYHHTIRKFSGVEDHVQQNGHDLEINCFKYDQFGNEEKDLQKVRNDYIKAIVVEHDHENNDYPGEVFCVKHREVFCKSCKFRRHSVCTEYISINRANQVLFESGQYIQIISSLKECHMMCSTALNESRKEKQLLSSRESAIIEQIQELKNAMLCHINKLEHDLLETIYSSNNSAFKRLQKAEYILKRIKVSSGGMLDSLKAKTKDGTETSNFKTAMKYRIKHVLFNNMLQHIINYCHIDKLYECLFETEHTVESISYCTESLGKLNVNQFQSQLPSILACSKDKPVNTHFKLDDSESSILFASSDGATCDENYLYSLMDSYSKPEKRVTRWSSPDFPKHGIVGMICLDKNDMIVLDRISCSIIMIGKEGNQISSYGFKCIPWGMTPYGDNVIAVTVPGENKIILIAVEFKTFVLRKEITCAVEPSSITSHKDNIYVSSYPWSDKAALYKLTEDGKVKATLDKDNTGKRLFKAPLDIALDKTTNYLFVCDSGLKKMLVFDEELQERFKIDLEYIGHPSSLTLDSRGNIYICGKLSNVIYKVTTEKQTGKVIFTEDDGLSRPQAICTVPGEKYICVLCARDNLFRILNIS